MKRYSTMTFPWSTLVLLVPCSYVSNPAFPNERDSLLVRGIAVPSEKNGVRCPELE